MEATREGQILSSFLRSVPGLRAMGCGLAAAVLLCVGRPCLAADWKVVAKGAEGQLFSVDFASLRPAGGAVRAWVMTRYAAGRRGEAAQGYLSEKALWTVDCQKDLVSVVSRTAYSGSEADGSVVESIAYPYSDPAEPLVQGSLGQEIGRAVCEGANGRRGAGQSAGAGGDLWRCVDRAGVSFYTNVAKEAVRDEYCLRLTHDLPLPAVARRPAGSSPMRSLP